MSLSDTRAFFVDVMDDLGYTQWTESFNEPIPETVIQNTYHIQFPSVTGIKLNQHVQETEIQVILTAFVFGYRDVPDAVDTALELTEDIIQATVAPSVRLGTTIKNVIFNDMELAPFKENDNERVVRIDLNFTAVVPLQV